MKKVVFDIETTGMNFEKGDKIVEFGALVLNENNQLTGEIFHVYINPEHRIPHNITAIHGLTRKFLKNYPLFDEIKEDLYRFIEGKVLIAHLLPFDLGFLEHELGFELPNEKIDMLVLARNLFPGRRNNLDALCERFSVDISKIPYRGALLNAYCSARVYQELMRIYKAE